MERQIGGEKLSIEEVTRRRRTVGCRMGGTARYVDSQHEKPLTKTELKHVTTITDQQALTLFQRWNSPSLKISDVPFTEFFFKINCRRQLKVEKY